MSVVEEPNGKPQIFSKWGHKEFLVIRGICFFSPNQIFPILAFFISLVSWFGRERTETEIERIPCTGNLAITTAAPSLCLP